MPLTRGRNCAVGADGIICGNYEEKCETIRTLCRYYEVIFISQKKLGENGPDREKN